MKEADLVLQFKDKLKEKKSCPQGTKPEATIICKSTKPIETSWRSVERRRLASAVQQLREANESKRKKTTKLYDVSKEKLFNSKDLQETTNSALAWMDVATSLGYEMSAFIPYAVSRMLDRQMIKQYQDPFRRYSNIVQNVDTKGAANRFWTIQCVMQLTLLHYSKEKGIEAPHRLRLKEKNS